MSVIVSKRSISNMQFYKTARDSTVRARIAKGIPIMTALQH